MSVSAGPPCEHSFVDVSLETGDVLQPTATSLPG
jgi:hypothetical protein